MTLILREIDASEVQTSREFLSPTASVRYASPEEFAEFSRVLRTPGAVWMGAILSGSAYRFSQYNSPVHGHVVVWQSNLTEGRRGWYTGILPIECSSSFL
jgi:hypothetical protein